VCDGPRRDPAIRVVPAVSGGGRASRDSTPSGALSRSSSGWCDEIDPFAQAGLERVESVDDRARLSSSCSGRSTSLTAPRSRASVSIVRVCSRCCWWTGRTSCR
jgi:hypothetical protein